MIELRPFKRADAAATQWLHHETISTINSKDYSSEQIEKWSALNSSAEWWAKSLLKNIAYVACDGSEIVGFGDVTREGFVLRLYVHKDHQGKGIASKLLNALEQDVRKIGLERIWLESTETAHTFYQKNGYSDIESKMKDMRGTPLKVYVMEKKFPARKAAIGETQ